MRPSLTCLICCTICCLSLSFQACNPINLSNEDIAILNHSIELAELEVREIELECRILSGRIAVKIRNSGYRETDMQIMNRLREYEKSYHGLKQLINKGIEGVKSARVLIDSLNGFCANIEADLEVASMDDRWLYMGNGIEKLLLQKEWELQVARIYREAIGNMAHMFGNQDIRFYAPFLIANRNKEGVEFQLFVEGRFLSIDSIYLHPDIIVASILKQDSQLFRVGKLDSQSTYIMNVKYWNDQYDHQPKNSNIDSMQNYTRIEIFD